MNRPPIKVKAIIRGKLLRIPVRIKVKSTRRYLYLPNTNQVFDAWQPQRLERTFYNTRIRYGGHTYYCNSIDLEFLN